MNLLNKLLVKLRLKCSCGSWLPLFKRHKIHFADITSGDEVVEAVYLPMRLCKQCGWAVKLRPTTIKLKRSGDHVGTFHADIRAHIGEGDDG